LDPWYAYEDAARCFREVKIIVGVEVRSLYLVLEKMSASEIFTGHQAKYGVVPTAESRMLPLINNRT